MDAIAKQIWMLWQLKKGKLGDFPAVRLKWEMRGSF